MTAPPLRHRGHVRLAPAVAGELSHITAPPLRLLIDTDPGVDDAIALLMALRHPDTIVEAITVVAGNAGLGGADVPVYAGAAQALLCENRRAPDAHGDDGLGNLDLRPRNAEPAPGHAV